MATQSTEGRAATARKLLDTARELYEPLSAAADALEPGGSVQRETIDLILDAGLRGLMVPEAVGGLELPLADLVDIYEEIARADGSIGWVYFACDLTAAYFGA